MSHRLHLWVSLFVAAIVPFSLTYLHGKLLTLVYSIGLANAGSAREDLAEHLLPIVSDTSLSMDLSAVAALALGLIFVGSYENDVPSTIIQTMMERDDSQLNDPWSRYLSLGLALLYLGMLCQHV
jgi:26S proteasome regulatory subunit N1